MEGQAVLIGLGVTAAAFILACLASKVWGSELRQGEEDQLTSVVLASAGFGSPHATDYGRPAPGNGGDAATIALTTHPSSSSSSSIGGGGTSNAYPASNYTDKYNRAPPVSELDVELELQGLLGDIDRLSKNGFGEPAPASNGANANDNDNGRLPASVNHANSGDSGNHLGIDELLHIEILTGGAHLPDDRGHTRIGGGGSFARMLPSHAFAAQSPHYYPGMPMHLASARPHVFENAASARWAARARETGSPC